MAGAVKKLFQKLPNYRIASSLGHRNPIPLLPTSIYEVTGFDNPNALVVNPASSCSIGPESDKNGALEIYPSFSFEYLLNPYSPSVYCLSQPLKAQNFEADESGTMWADSVKKKRKKKMNKHKLRKLRRRIRGRS